jgi:hypothetical protein
MRAASLTGRNDLPSNRPPSRPSLSPITQFELDFPILGHTTVVSNTWLQEETIAEGHFIALSLSLLSPTALAGKGHQHLTFWMRKTVLREAKQLAQGRPARRWWRPDRHGLQALGAPHMPCSGQKAIAHLLQHLGRGNTGTLLRVGEGRAQSGGE